MTGTAFVSGGSGYIAGFIVRDLLTAGWAVHTTLRSLAREADLRALLAAQGVEVSALRCFAADLLDDAGWADALAGCTHALHVASPLQTGVPRHADELIVPARDGALRVLRAARDAGVRRVVMTSSVAAIAYGHGTGRHLFTERDWTRLEAPNLSPYVQSKTLAERAAREWVAREGAGLELCTVNPALVLGPVCSRDHSASLSVIRKMLRGQLRGLPDIGFGVVDVRDVADLHLRALVAPGLAGERFIASGRFMKLAEIAAVLRHELGSAAARVPTRRIPDVVLRIGALFSPMLRTAAGELGTVREHSSAHAREVLGWQPRPEAETIVDAARSLLALDAARGR
jgi:dihydroflavonol-4-reductase